MSSSYHSVSAMYLKAALGADGKPNAWLQRTVYPRSDQQFAVGTEYSAPDELGLGFQRFAVCDSVPQFGEWAGAGAAVCGWAVPVGGEYLPCVCRIQWFVINARWRRGKMRWSINWRSAGAGSHGAERVAEGLFELWRRLFPVPDRHRGGCRRVVQLAAAGAEEIQEIDSDGDRGGRSFLTYAASVVTLRV